MSISGAAGGAAQVWSGASARMPPQQKMSKLFDQIDTTGSGTITKAQFEEAFQTMNPPAAFKLLGADAVFAKLDPNGTGSVSKSDFVSGMTSLMSQARGTHHHHHGGGGASASSSAASGTSAVSGVTSPSNLPAAVSTVGSSTTAMSGLDNPSAPTSPWTGTIINTVA